MGFSISWIGVKGVDDSALLAALGVEDTGSVDEAQRAKLSWAQLAGGWRIIFSNDLDFASPTRIARLSSGGEAIGCVIEEHVMFSGVRAFRGGVEAWAVLHDPQDGARNLAVEGSPPKQLAEIRKRLLAKQESSDVEEEEVDYVFEIPVELAQAVCGYRHDEEVGAAFTILRRPGRSLGQRLSALFGRGSRTLRRGPRNP